MDYEIQTSEIPQMDGMDEKLPMHLEYLSCQAPECTRTPAQLSGHSSVAAAVSERPQAAAEALPTLRLLNHT